MYSPNQNSYLARQISDLACRLNMDLGKFWFWNLVVLLIMCNWIFLSGDDFDKTIWVFADLARTHRNSHWPRQIPDQVKV